MSSSQQEKALKDDNNESKQEQSSSSSLEVEECYCCCCQKNKKDGGTATANGASSTTSCFSNNSAAIVLVAKCPTFGKSKTRLHPLLGKDGATTLAKAMLLDVVESISLAVSHSKSKSASKSCSAVVAHKILLYAPPTNESELMMKSILNEAFNDDDNGDVASSWTFLPMMTPSLSSSNSSLASSNLTIQLTDALIRVRELIHHHQDGGDQRQQSTTTEATATTTTTTTRREESGSCCSTCCCCNNSSSSPSSSVIFVGMDSPEIPIDELIAAISFPSQTLLCPAADGGYGLLAVPSTLLPATKVFDGVRWSQPLTAISQLKALSDAASGSGANTNIKIGRLMYDIDEPNDVKELCYRLSTTMTTTRQQEENDDDDVLLRPSALSLSSSLSRPATEMMGGRCRHTRKALIELGQMK